MAKGRPKVYAIIPAAGSGTRLGGSLRKQFVHLGDRPILVHTVLRFERCVDVDEIIIAVPEQSVAETKALISRYRLHKVSKIVVGAKMRQGSVQNALQKLKLKPTDIILVHDGVRPFIEPAKISEVVQACREYDAAAVAVQPKDTVRRSEGGSYFNQPIDRSAVWLMQTPQGFKASIIKEAFAKAKGDRFVGTDEVALVERIGKKSRIISGTYDNIKITTPEDLELGALIMERWKLKRRG